MTRNPARYETFKVMSSSILQVSWRGGCSTWELDESVPVLNEIISTRQRLSLVFCLNYLAISPQLNLPDGPDAPLVNTSPK